MVCVLLFFLFTFYFLLGPNASLWRTIQGEYAQKLFEYLKEEKDIDYYDEEFEKLWLDVDDCRNNGIPVVEFRQEAGDLVRHFSSYVTNFLKRFS